MANVAVVVLVVLVVGVIMVMLRRHGDGIVPKRGMGIAADLGVLADTPRVRVRSVTTTGPAQVHVVLAPTTSLPDLDFDLRLGEDEFGFGLLHDWQRSDSPLAIVIPPASRLIRLRSVDGLQHLTLRRFDDV